MLKCFRGLGALNQVFVIDDEGWHRADAKPKIFLLAGSDFEREFVTIQNGLCTVDIKARAFNGIQEVFYVIQADREAEIGIEQFTLEIDLVSCAGLSMRPVQKSMRVEGVVYPLATLWVKCKACFQRALPNIS